MSPRKTRKGVKVEGQHLDVTLSDLDKITDTSEITLRTLRTRRQLKQKNSSDSDVEQSPQLNESKRTTRRGRGKKIVESTDDSSANTLITSTRKRTRKDKDASVLAVETIVFDNHNETQEPVSAVKSKVNRSRKRGGQKKLDITTHDSDNVENLPSDNNIIQDNIPKDLMKKDKINYSDDNVDSASNEDREVAIVSKKATKKSGKTPTISRFLQPRKCNLNSPNSVVTPECSPLTINLTPHRATKTPRKSPINIGSPKTHTLSPQRLSKTPRKLPVTSDSPVPTKKLPDNETLQTATNDLTPNKRKITSPKDTTSARSSNRRVSKSPKIIQRTPKSKSPRVTSKKIKKSPILKRGSQTFMNSRDLSPKKITSPSRHNEKMTIKSPILILKPYSPSDTTSPLANDSVTPITTPGTWKKLVRDVESPRRPRSIVKKRSPIEKSATPLRAVPTLKIIDSNECLNKSQIVSTNSTSFVTSAAKTNAALTSSTPRERIRRSLNLSPSISVSPTASSAPVSVEVFYGTLPKTFTHIHNEEKNFRIENESNVLITDDDSSFDISGIKAVDISKNDVTVIGDIESETTSDKGEKTANDTYELAESLTPVSQKQNKTTNDTYDLDEPRTPGLRKRQSLLGTNVSVTKNVDEQMHNKRACRVRFASPSLNSLDKIALTKDRSRSSTPGNKGLRKRTISQMNNTSVSTIKTLKTDLPSRRRSNSLTNISVGTKTPVALHTKKRSLSVVDVNSRSTQKNLQNESVKRLSKPRISIISDKMTEVKRMSAKKPPNFTQIHQKKFAEMESIVDAKKRMEERHRALMNNITSSPSTSKIIANITSRMKTTKAGPSVPVNGSFNRFGYKVRKEEATKVISKQSTSRRIEEQKTEKRMMLKGVRSNRRFELQMKMRGINP